MSDAEGTEWPRQTLAELGAQITSGSRGWAKYYADCGSLFVRITNLRRSCIRPDLTHSRYVSIDPGESEAHRTRLRGGDVLISITADIGIIGHVSETFPAPAYINQHIARVRFDSRSVDSRYVAYYLASFVPQREFVGMTDQGAKAGMNLTTVAKLSIPVPDIGEQMLVADALESCDALIGALERQMAKKRDVKRGMMQQLLTGQTRLPGFFRPWDVLQVASASHLKARIGWQGLTTSEYRKAGQYRLIGGTDFRNGRVDWDTTPYVDKWRFDQDVNIQLQIGDLLITKDGTIGKVAYLDVLPEPSTLNSGIFVLRPKRDSYDSGFLFYMLRSRLFSDFVAGLSAGSTINHLYQKDLSTLKFLVPDELSEQRAIAAILFDIDSELEALELRLGSVRAIKQGMVQELLSGRSRDRKATTAA